MHTPPDRPPRSQAFPPASHQRSGARWLVGLPLALQFLTILPVAAPVHPAATYGEASATSPNMATALPWFPLVGAALGALLALLDWALTPIFVRPVRDALLLAIPALLTGMLHLDGFADCCDALLGTRTSARRLEILRDSRLGAYGVVGVVLLLFLRFTALGALPPHGRIAALVVAPLLGRWAMVYAVARYPYARETGAGASFRSGQHRLLAASCSAVLALCAILWLTGVATGATSWPWHALVPAAARGVLLVGLGAVMTVGWCRWASQRLGGGLTGDTYGALNELVELATLLAIPPLLAAHLPF